MNLSDLQNLCTYSIVKMYLRVTFGFFIVYQKFIAKNKSLKTLIPKLWKKR